jgi:hypothetical protein
VAHWAEHYMMANRRGLGEERLSGSASRWFADELSGVVFCLLCHSAIASAETSQPPSSSDVNVAPCALAGPGSVTAALSCPDKALAMQALDEAGCFLPNSPGAMEVRRIWLRRESLAPDAAGRDPVVQAFMANCLVESTRGSGSLGPAEASAVAFLRQALNEPSLGIAGIAMAGLSGVLVKDDVTTIVRLGSTQSALAIPAIAGLSTSCIPEAKAGMASIRAAYAGTQQQVEIDRFVDGSKELMEHCGREGMSSSKAFVGEVALPGTSHAVPRARLPDATQVKAALGSSRDPKALQTLLDVQCTPEHADVVDEMRKAWRGRGTAGSTLVSDPVAQAVMARCLIQADSAVPAKKAEIMEATAILRSAVHSDDVMAVVAAVEGLAIVGADEDVTRIAEVARRVPALLNHVVRIVGFTCGANNLKTLALMHKEAATEQVRDRIDTVYKRVEPVREQTCGAGK